MLSDLIARYVPAQVRKPAYLIVGAVLAVEQFAEANGVDFIPNHIEEVIVTVAGVLATLVAASQTRDVTVVAPTTVEDRSI